VRGLEMIVQGLEAFPLFNDRNDIFVQKLRRKAGVKVDCRKILDTTPLLPNAGDVGLEDFEELGNLSGGDAY